MRSRLQARAAHTVDCGSLSHSLIYSLLHKNFGLLCGTCGKTRRVRSPFNAPPRTWKGPALGNSRGLFWGPTRWAGTHFCTTHGASSIHHCWVVLSVKRMPCLADYGESKRPPITQRCSEHIRSSQIRPCANNLCHGFPSPVTNKSNCLEKALAVNTAAWHSLVLKQKVKITTCCHCWEVFEELLRLEGHRFAKDFHSRARHSPSFRGRYFLYILLQTECPRQSGFPVLAKWPFPHTVKCSFGFRPAAASHSRH